MKCCITIECDDHHLTKVLEKFMSAVSDFAAKVNANFAEIKAGIQRLDDLIIAFNNSPGVLSDQDQAMLDDIAAQSATLAAAASVVVPPGPTPTGVPAGPGPVPA